MSRLFEEIGALMRTRRMYIVDTQEGTWDEYTAEEFPVVMSMLDDCRFQPRMSLKAALELCHMVCMKKAGRN